MHCLCHDQIYQGVDEYMHVYILYMHTKGYTVVFQCEATVKTSVHKSYVCVIFRRG